MQGPSRDTGSPQTNKKTTSLLHKWYRKSSCQSSPWCHWYELQLPFRLLVESHSKHRSIALQSWQIWTCVLIHSFPLRKRGQKMGKNSKLFDIIVLAGMVVNIILAVFLILYYFDFLWLSGCFDSLSASSYSPEMAHRKPMVSSRKSGTIRLRLVILTSVPVLV